MDGVTPLEVAVLVVAACDVLVLVGGGGGGVVVVVVVVVGTLVDVVVIGDDVVVVAPDVVNDDGCVVDAAVPLVLLLTTLVLVTVVSVCNTERRRLVLIGTHAAFASKIGMASVITSPAPNASTYGTLNVCVFLSITIHNTLQLCTTSLFKQANEPERQCTLIPKTSGRVVIGVVELRARISAMYTISQSKILPHN